MLPRQPASELGRIIKFTCLGQMSLQWLAKVYALVCVLPFCSPMYNQTFHFRLEDWEVWKFGCCDDSQPQTSWTDFKIYLLFDSRVIPLGWVPFFLAAGIGSCQSSVKEGSLPPIRSAQLLLLRLPPPLRLPIKI